MNLDPTEDFMAAYKKPVKTTAHRQHKTTVKAEGHKIHKRQPKTPINPDHYTRYKIEPLLFIGENNLDFFQGNIIKYLLRWRHKDGVEALYKAREYLDRYIRMNEGKTEWLYEESTEEKADTPRHKGC